MRKWIIAGIVVAAAAVAIIIGLAAAGPLARPATVVGGIRYRIEGITYGTNHHFATGSPFLGRLRQRLPQGWQWILPNELRYDFQTTEPEAVVYLSAYDVAKELYVLPSWDRFRTVDEHGCAFDGDGYSGGGAGSAALSVSTVYLRSFPRRASRFKLRGYQPGGAVIELPVPNPDRGPFPRWTPEPIPVRRTVDGMTYELTAFKTSRYWGRNGEHYGQPLYTVLREGEDVTKEFRPITERLDETGNRSSFLCPYEPAWRLETKFLRNGKASFPPDQVWCIPALRVPENGKMIAFNQTHTFSNVTVHLVALTGAGMFRMSNGVVVLSAPWGSGMTAGLSSSTSTGNGKTLFTLVCTEETPGLLLSVANMARRDDLLIRHRDQTGRVGDSRARGGANDYFWFTLSDLQQATTIDLEIIVQRPATLEYTVAPPKPTAP
jgi:hypothetical protein